MVAPKDHTSHTIVILESTLSHLVGFRERRHDKKKKITAVCDGENIEKEAHGKVNEHRN